MGINRNRHHSSAALLKNIALLLTSLVMMIHVFLIISPVQANNVDGGGREEDGQQHNPAPAERGIGITAFNGRWETFLAWVKLTWMNLRPPPTPSPSPGYGKMKEVSKRTFEMGKETMEKAAASAAELVVEKAKDKLKGMSTTSDENPDAEL